MKFGSRACLDAVDSNYHWTTVSRRFPQQRANLEFGGILSQFHVSDPQQMQQRKQQQQEQMEG